MQFTVILPDTVDEATIQALAEAVAAAGGTVEPQAPGPEMEPELDDMAMMEGAPMPPPPGPGPLPGGPGMGLPPGQAMAQKGARALRPRPGY